MCEFVNFQFNKITYKYFHIQIRIICENQRFPPINGRVEVKNSNKFFPTYDSSINGIDQHSQICFFLYSDIVPRDVYIVHCDTEIRFLHTLEFL